MNAKATQFFAAPRAWGMIDAMTSLLGWLTNPLVFSVLVIWTLFWKAIALWKAARARQRWWYLAMLILNTLGILEMVYLALYSKSGRESVAQTLRDILAPVNKQRSKKKEQAKKKILALFGSQATVTNDDVQKVAGVSEATATRYLDELQKRSKIIQHGISGRGVHYTKKE